MLDILEIYSYNAIGKSKFLLTTSCACSILVYFSVCVRARVCVRVCVCVCVSIHREGFICRYQLEYQRIDQRCYVEDVYFLSQVPSSLL